MGGDAHAGARARFSSTRRCARNGRDLARKLCHAVRNKPPPTDTAIMAVSTRAPQTRARPGRDLARKLCRAVRNKPSPTDTAIMAVSTRAPQARARLPRAAPGHFAALALSLRAPARLLARRPLLVLLRHRPGSESPLYSSLFLLQYHSRGR